MLLTLAYHYGSAVVYDHEQPVGAIGVKGIPLYVKRMKTAVKAITDGKGELGVRIVQLVTLLREREPVEMSKRAADFATLREVFDEVGRDAIRFMMLTRSSDAPLDCDLAQVVEHSKDNRVFYVDGSAFAPGGGNRDSLD
jgi:arginyl-tRNA synthetase